MTSLKPLQLDTSSFDAFAKASLSAAESYFASLGEFARLFMSSMNPTFQKAMQDVRRSCCDIPPACWAPRSLGEVRSFVCAGATASVRIRVTNCQLRMSSTEVSFADPAQGKVEPPSATLGPMERKSFTASIAVPSDAAKGREIETLLWVRGCNAYYLRWIVEVRENASQSCHEIEVEDCLDYVHHWYDHFYCDRPCFHEKATRNPLGG